ncbi:MAG: DUF192 domain-containing protein [Candidatus Pacebacteria bacterium]|nr:DUF192 domain-containing protein [Candidatus Paceibacterota bacterium]MDR3583450.1 DUF192 domain-containing protein [Candidatus Paceibacterota bacterium]
MRNKMITFFVVLLALSLGLFFIAGNNAATVVINGQKFSASLATTPAERQKGLGDRDSLCRNCAMLFKFEKKGDYMFWMKDMRFDLDIIWIADGKIVYIAKDISHEALNTIDPKTPADNVLEINAGLAERYGFKIGDAISIK